MKEHDPIYIYNVNIKPEIKFKNAQRLMSGDYFMVFTSWSPSRGQLKTQKTNKPLSPFGSWYLMRKGLFIMRGGKIECGTHYIKEKLSAATLVNQQLALDRITEAQKNGAAGHGIITDNVIVKGRIHILKGDFQGLGQVIFADACQHPRLRGKSYSHNEVSGLGAHPWSPLADMKTFIDAFK